MKTSTRDRSRTFARIFALLSCFAVGASMYGCSLLAEFDRSKIPTGNDGSIVLDGTTDGPGTVDQTTGDVVTDRPADSPADSPVDSPADAGSDATDARSDVTDAGSDVTDAGSDVTDAGSDVTDAGSDVTDAGSDVTDAGSDATDAADDASDAGDGGDGGSLLLNGCTIVDFVLNDQGTDAGVREINFPDDAGNNLYQPRCMRIRQGQAVTFIGPFVSHPLQQSPSNANSPLPPNGTPLNTGTSMTYVFNQLGTYGFECAIHGGAGMQGAIDVIPP